MDLELAKTSLFLKIFCPSITFKSAPLLVQIQQLSQEGRCSQSKFTITKHSFVDSNIFEKNYHDGQICFENNFSNKDYSKRVSYGVVNI